MRDKEKYRQWRRNWYAKNADKERKRKREAYKNSDIVRQRVKNATAINKRNNPLKWKCRKLFAQAIRRGKIIRQNCEDCGKANAEGHHKDYKEPYLVKWLCKLCHMKLHRGARVTDEGVYNF